MAITERSRHNVHKHFEGTMGEELAATLMEMLPGVGWADVARRRDVEELRAATTADIEELRAATTADIENLRVTTTKDVEALRDWASVRFDAVDNRIDSMVTHSTLRKTTFAIVAANAAVVTIAAGLAKLF